MGSTGARGWLPALRSESAIGRLRQVVLGRRFTPEFIGFGDIYAGTRYPQTLSHFGPALSPFPQVLNDDASTAPSLSFTILSETGDTIPSETKNTLTLVRRVALFGSQLTAGLALRSWLYYAFWVAIICRREALSLHHLEGMSYTCMDTQSPSTCVLCR